MKRVSAFLAAFVLTACAAAGQDNPLSWVNATRRAAAQPPVVPDEVLSETARLWAQRLLKAGVLSHRGADGSSALDRYRLLGGTDARVGEILGAGPSLRDIEDGWMRSDEHRTLTLDPGWTHVGWGMAADASAQASAQVWVVLFCEKLVQDLRIEEEPGRVSVSGAFVPPTATGALLYSGLVPVQPDSWDPVTRGFAFVVTGPILAGYLRLGFLSVTGEFRLTNAFTLPREKGPPGATDRFSAPAAQP